MKPQTQATYLLVQSICFLAYLGPWTVYLSGRHETPSPSATTKAQAYPKSICLLSKNTPPTGTLFEIHEAVEAVVIYKQKPVKKVRYIGVPGWLHWLSI